MEHVKPNDNSVSVTVLVYAQSSQKIDC